MSLLSIPQTIRLPITRYRFLPLILLSITFLLAVVGYSMRGLNLGVDFRGGLLIEAKVSALSDLNDLRHKLKEMFHKEFSIQEAGRGEQVLLIRTEPVPETKPLLEQMKQVLGQDVVYRRVESVGPKVGEELILDSLYAIGWALLLIMAYVWIRFEWQFSLGALVALLHDCLGLLVFFIISQKEFNEGAVVALLITASYSINDTVIIFDRIRENRFFKKGSSFDHIITCSINETLSRTLLTSMTTLLALGMLYLFGGEVISAFSLPIFFGILIGTYSSIMIAVPLLRFFPLSVEEGKKPDRELGKTPL